MTHEAWSKDGAEEIARQIMVYWLNKGHKVTAWAERVPRFQEVYQVRSDLTNGAPSAKS
jgi:hypothetical protein